jgi:gluconate 2-dehydrogenase alpha chain
MEKAAKDLGYHPFPAPSANMSGVYTNPEGVTLGACEYCGHCERFGCEANAKASPQACILPVLLPDPKFELRTYAYVKELVYDKQAKKVKAVRYVDTRSGEEFEQPAGLVIMGAYVFNNVLLMLTAGIGEPYDHTTGKGAVGRNYCYQISGNGVTVFFESKEINPFMASGAHGTNIDDFNGDNFDHSGLGFFGGAWISAGTTNGRPILTRPVPPGTPRWGRDWKRATAKWYNHAFGVGASGCNYAHRENFLDLDPTYKDALGRPLIRMSYNFRNNDHKMAEYLAGVLDRIATAMKPTIKGNVNVRRGNYNVVPYQSTHNTGGTMMGADPKTSAVNRYCQAWDADNLFVMGASLFPQNASYNPTGLVGALAYWSAEAIATKYIKSPGPLVHA